MLKRRNFQSCLTACSRALSKRSSCIVVLSVILCGLSGFCDANVSSKISCDDDEMRVEVKGSNITEAYLLGLKNYPEASCQPDRVSSDLLKFRLSLRDFYRCGTAQILNKITGSKTFYNRIVVVAGGQDQEIMVKCSQEGVLPHPVGNNFINATMRRRRDVLPAGFEEQDARYVGDVVNRTAEPILGMVVKQDGRLIGNELLVSPGSPLSMEVTLDPRSAPLYGIIVSQLYVTDNSDQTEVILTNGCSVDPYLFENFVTRDGDLLTAKFRAFKFPESNFVLFRGTVNVCLGICQPSDCRNGQIGYGRRRRSIDMDRLHGLYEAQMTIVLKIQDEDPNDPDQMAAVLRPSRQVRNEPQLKRDTSLQAEFVSVSSGNSHVTSSASLLISIGTLLMLGLWLNRNSC